MPRKLPPGSVNVEPSQIKDLWLAVLDGVDDTPLEFAVNYKLKEHRPDLFERFWISVYEDAAACEYIADRLPKDYQPPSRKTENEQAHDAYDIAPDANETQQAASLLHERNGDQAYGVRRRARPKGRRRVNALAALIVEGPRKGQYRRICNDESAIVEFLERERPLGDRKRALEPHRPSAETTAMRSDLARKVQELTEMGAHQVAIARCSFLVPAGTRRKRLTIGLAAALGGSYTRTTLTFRVA